MLVEFVGYAADCIVTGQLEVHGTRVSDAIDGSAVLTVHHATLTSLLDGRQVFEPELVLDRDELLAVRTGGPGGEVARRIRTVRHRLRAELGPYAVLGQLHVKPGASALRSLGARRKIVPLTDATILVPTERGVEANQAPVILINASHIDAVSLIGTDDSPWELPTADQVLGREMLQPLRDRPLGVPLHRR